VLALKSGLATPTCQSDRSSLYSKLKKKSVEAEFVAGWQPPKPDCRL
jgi:hypothetical protein